jgi:TatD DNase family protein
MPELPELPELIDTHCHLNYDYAPKQTEDLVREAHEAGVSHLITIGVDPKTLSETIAISERFENVYHTVGFHPHEAATVLDEDLVTLEACAAHPKCRAIGEIGLDYHYDHSPRDVQKKRLDDQLKIAARVKLPIVIHSRDGEDDLLQALTAYAQGLAPGAIPGVIHCFTGTKAFGQACLDLGFYISFSGILTFKKVDDLRECAQEFPLERLLVETDSPYLAPIPNRGKKCEPSMVRLTAMKLAEIKGLTFEEVARATTANARRIFRI